LNKAILNKADLREANLSGSKLIGATLCESNLSETNLYKADLYEVDLSGTDLSKTHFWGANLAGAKLDGVILKDGQWVVFHSENSDKTLTGRVFELDNEFLTLETKNGNIKFTRHRGDIEILTTNPEHAKESQENLEETIPPFDRGLDMGR
jgi:uncharacterized protein YjbI with pentapeptide repeats